MNLQHHRVVVEVHPAIVIHQAFRKFYQHLELVLLSKIVGVHQNVWYHRHPYDDPVHLDSVPHEHQLNVHNIRFVVEDYPGRILTIRCILGELIEQDNPKLKVDLILYANDSQGGGVRKVSNRQGDEIVSGIRLFDLILRCLPWILGQRVEEKERERRRKREGVK